jgi:hypothetical protein
MIKGLNPYIMRILSDAQENVWNGDLWVCTWQKITASYPGGGYMIAVLSGMTCLALVYGNTNKE